MKKEQAKIQNEEDDDKKKKRLIFIIIGIVIAVALAIVLPLTLTKRSTSKYTYGNPTYTWATDYLSCTAERVANEDPNHKETETVPSTYQVVDPAKCEEDGTGRYTATFTNEAFETQTNDVTITATGHTYGNPTYTWSSDYSSCTAERVCLNDSSHIDTETADSTYEETTPASYDTEGEGIYTATFTNLAFTTQTKTVTIEKLAYYGEFPILSDDEKTLTYGLYPHSNVNDSDLVASLNELTTPESNGYYFYNKVYYAKLSATPYNPSYVFDNGTTIVSGTTYWFKCEPITWNVLSNNSGEYYILSNVLLDVHRYNEYYEGIKDGHYANNYEYSEIRSWLNNDFYNSAFALGNSHIQTTTIDNSAATTNSATNPYACDNTQDKVFLPSYQDYINSDYGFSTSTSSTDTRCCIPTDWARARGAYYNTSSPYLYNGYYWTRSPNSDYSNNAWYVYRDGSLRSSNVHGTYFSMRPALTIKIA